MTTPSDHSPARGDAQPTEAYPPADEQPTQSYPPADEQPTQAYPPAGQPAYGAPGAPSAYGQPSYGAPAQAYGAPEAPVSDADRPRGLAWASLGLAIGGLVLVGIALIPLLWVSLILALVGGLLLLVALILGIVTLASKKQGGKGLGIGAIAVSVLGGILWVFAIVAAFVWIGLAAASSSGAGSEPDVSVSQEAVPGDDGGEEAPAGTYDEAAYLAAVRPEVLTIMQEIEPSITEELVAEFYTDDILITAGKGILLAGDLGEETVVRGLVDQSGGVFDEEQAIRFYTVVRDAAQLYLVEE